MRTSSLAGSLFASFVAFAAYGCTLDVSGAKATTSSGGGNDPTTSTVTSNVGGAGPSSASASSGQTGGGGGMTSTTVTSTATGTTTSTGGGCTDPANGTACVKNAPSGWTLVAFAPGDSASCPAGSSGLVNVAEAPTPVDTKCGCACDCTGPENNPCVHGTMNVGIGTQCGAVGGPLDITGGCDPIGLKFGGKYNSIKATPLGVTAIDVTSNGVVPNTQPGANGVTCSPDTDPAGGCASDQTCLTKSIYGSLCVQQAGEVPCPGSPFTVRRVVGAPGMVDDQRSCGQCTCSSSATGCSNPTFAGYTDGSCNSAPSPAAVVSMTRSHTASGDWDNDDHFIYKATPDNQSCNVKGAPADVMGTLSVQSPTTICCQP